ncbi:4'-phosphopantetheinyl transferase family protein [Lihuaxuella thermophila]|uniref:4'-phosphopantetheinyl transferase n=1 Tax=Lihuaxuella thermophila TaxID=1173111 RepID=A0A1H8G7D6_9BACL|nr:4'-phosphopantetheinyl transferase superfamily protein [Lihuaxuella thermophila]SEN39779.1 4'-phosphopantetheinyl transferase [Lihuaxuella thermophila]
MRKTLQPGAVHIWSAPLSAAAPALRHLLNAKELERLDAFRKEEDRKRGLISYGLLRLLLAQILHKDPKEIPISRACPDCGKEHGKPRLLETSPESIEISVSHSGQLVVIALARSVPIGIDVEEIRRDVPVDQLALDILSPLEQREFALLPEAEKQEAFYVYWTRKEAVLKALGLGLSVPLKQVSVTGRNQPPRLIRWDSAHSLPDHVSMFPLSLGSGYEACLSVIGSCHQVLMEEGASVIDRWNRENHRGFL